MNRFEQEEVVRLPCFLKQDLQFIQSKSEKLESKIKLQLKFVERFNQILHESKLNLVKLSQDSKFCLENQKRAFFKFDRQNFEELLKRPSSLSELFFDFLLLKTNRNFEFEEVKNRMQISQTDKISKSVFDKAVKILGKWESSTKSEKIVLSWLKNTVIYEKIKDNTMNEKKKIRDINDEIQKAMQDVKKLTTIRDKYESNHKDIKKYLENESLTVHSTEATYFSKKSSNTSRQTSKQSFELLKISQTDLSYHELKTDKPPLEPYIKLEDSSELGCCSYKLFCFY